MFKNQFFAMRSLALVIALILCQARLHAQDKYFLYVQTDNEQAFYARFQGRTLSSSANGYLILPRVSDTAVTLTIGFPKRLFPEQTFNIGNIRSDKGFLLKNIPEKGWVLAGMQDAGILAATTPADPAAPVTAPRSTADPFSELLSTVIADSSLRETPIVRTAPPPVPATQPSPAVPAKPDTSVAMAAQPLRPTPAAVPAVQAETGRPEQGQPGARSAGSRKLLEQIDATGVQMIFTDQVASGVTDTVSVFIPKDGSARTAPTAAVKPVSDVETPAAAGRPGVPPAVPDRTDCKSFVNVKDLGLLRRRMEALADEDAKVALALRSFRESCYSTEQVRSLLVVFGREEGRFKLLDAAYPYVTDPSKFPELESVLKDSYFIYRFRKKTAAPASR